MLSKMLEPFVEPLLAMARSQFPRECNNCRRRYENFKQYLRETQPVGEPTMLPDFPGDPGGMISWTNCSCGNTLVLECEDMKGSAHRQFIQTLEEFSRSSGRPTRELLIEIRDEVRRRALSRP